MGTFKIVKLIGQGLNNTIITGGLVPKGAYDNAVDYAVGDSVDYNGSSYVMHTNAAAGVLPTDTTKWQVLANKGATGATGAAGTAGADGQGVPTGGTTGQVLAKNSNTNYDTEWIDAAGVGDMLKSVYDMDNDGVVDDAEDAQLFSGAAPAYYLDTDNHTDGTTNKVFTATEQTKLSGTEALADVTDAGNVGSSIHGATAKTTPVDADTMPLIDSAALNVLKKVTWANIKATLKTYFDTLYNLYVHPNHSGDVTSVADGAQTIANDAVTNAKAANMAANTIKGRITASTGDPEDLTAANVRTIINVADGANAYTHPNHSGDVTSVADGAQTIANDAVTYAKMQNVSATDKVLGRYTAGSGDVEEIACTAAGRALLDDATAADQRTTLGLGTAATTAATDYATAAQGTTADNAVPKSTYDAHTVLYATTDNTPAALTVAEQTVVGRATGGNIAAIAIDSDLSSVSGSDDTVPSAKATKAMGDLKLPLAGGTMSGNITLGENTSIALDPAGSADGKYSGITVAGTAGYTQSFGDLVYLDPTDSRWEAVDANSASGADGDARGVLGIVVATGTDGAACTILLHGIVRADAKFPTFTINNPIYVSETAGSVTQTQPTTTDVVIRIVGSALTADEMYFNPDRTWITHT